MSECVHTAGTDFSGLVQTCVPTYAKNPYICLEMGKLCVHASCILCVSTLSCVCRASECLPGSVMYLIAVCFNNLHPLLSDAHH